MKMRREILLAALLGLAYLAAFAAFGPAYGLRMSVEALCYALIALGLTVQWGYAGLFNAGVMGFIAIGAFASMVVSFPVNDRFWNSDMPERLAMVIGVAAAGGLLTWAIMRWMKKGRLRALLALMSGAATWLAASSMLDPLARDIEHKAGFIGGLGMPVLLGWAAAGAAAGLLAWAVGRVCLGLRSDYLAIATLGIAEIIKALLKNADWLTRGTLTVSPLPWPLPGAGEIGFIAARSAWLALMAVMVVFSWWLMQRAWAAPWGRMMRAIRDNEAAAAAMGKDTTSRRLEIFILGSVFIGVGGAALITFTGVFDPSGFLPLNHTFLVWVMIILGGAGNNSGAIFGALLVYVVWVMSEPAALLLFQGIESLAANWPLIDLPDNLQSRALQARVFTIGLTITLVLRFAPDGLLPEKPPKAE